MFFHGDKRQLSQEPFEPRGEMVAKAKSLVIESTVRTLFVRFVLMRGRGLVSGWRFRLLLRAALDTPCPGLACFAGIGCLCIRLVEMKVFISLYEFQN